MNLNLAKNKVMNELGITHHFLFKGIRNQIEEFDGIIIKCFPAIFVIETDDGFIKSFSYNDYIIKNIKIIS